MASTDTTPPVVSTSTAGTPAAQNSIAATSTASAAKQQQTIQTMYKYQTFKGSGRITRMTITMGSRTFSADIDPNDISRKQQKRYAALDVLTGVVVQDFGFKAEILEIKGTTGSRYYDAIVEMDNIFTNQNVAAGKPTPVTVNVEGITYTAYWSDFSFSRMINAQAGNLVQYAFSFTVLSRQTLSGATDTIAAGATTVQSTAAALAASAGTPQTQDISWTDSMYNYIFTNNLMANKQVVLDFLTSHFKTSLYGAVPKPNTPLNASQKLTVAVAWVDVVGNM